MDKDAPNSSSSLSKVYAFWKDFDLEKEKLYLAEKRKKLTENKENSIKKQKKWGVGSADQDATSAEASLLLDYIAEVNRADEAENAFIELSDKICRASTVPSIYSDDNKKIKWDFTERKVPFDGFKGKEPRFLQDYIPIKSLGEGGFGEAFKCEKRIDRKLYAVKKILIKDNEKPESILSEVYALSRVEHRNIIRYYDGWIEPFGDYPITKNLEKDLKCESSCSTATSATTKSTVDPDSNALYTHATL